MPPRGWAWDATLFQGSAHYYEQGRLPYAPGLENTISDLLGPARHGRLLDVGCGPGTLIRRLALLFDASVGLDPDPEMIAEARLRAADDGLTRARFVQARAEDLPMGLGTFDVAMFGQSFHWMERDRVAGTVHDMLLPGGLFIQISDRKDAPARDPSVLPDPEPPYEGIRALVTEFLGPDRRAGRGVLRHGTPGDEIEVLARQGFGGARRIRIPGGEIVPRPVDDVVAWVHSRSESAPALFGKTLEAFDAALRALLLAQTPTGGFAEYLPDSELLVWSRA